MSWENLKIGLRKCLSKTKLKMVFFLFFLCSLQSFCQSSALSNEELIKIDQIQDPATLKEIIKLQNQLVIEYETTLNLVDQGLIQLTILLVKSGQQLTVAYDEANLLKNQLLMLSTDHNIELKAEYDRGFKDGIIVGNITGGVFGGTLSFGIARSY